MSFRFLCNVAFLTTFFFSITSNVSVLVVVNDERKKYLETQLWRILRFSTILKLACFIMWEVPGLNLGLEAGCPDERVLFFSVRHVLA